MKRLTLGVVFAALFSALVAAAPAKSTAPPTIILDAPATAGAASATLEPHLGDQVTFTVTYPKTLDHYGVRIQVLCYQDANLVYGAAGPYDQAFLLGGAMSNWFLTDGPATCHADLYYWSYNGGQKFNPLASTEFDAAGR